MSADRFAARLATDCTARCGLAAGQRLVVATSGGVDSTVLFRTLRGLGFDAVPVYVHHGLRAEANGEAAFVVAMGEQAGAAALVVAAPVGAGNRQEAAREARYAALGAAARRLGAAAVATGHTATDQAETVLLALVRGAGLRGLGGMAPRRTLDAAGDTTGDTAGDAAGDVALVRPLLWATRAEVEAHARAQGWMWRDDASNATDAYRRNRFRHTVLPLLDAEGGPATAARIAAAADDARAALDAGPGGTLAGLAVPDARGASLPLVALRALSADARRAVFAEALRAVAPDAPRSRVLVARVEALVSAEPGRRVGVGAAMVWRDRDRLRLVRDARLVEAAAVGADGAATALGRLGRTRVEAGGVPGGFDASRWTETVDARALLGDVVLRPWKPGDRIVPVGGGTRLVSDLLTDARVPPSERADALVVTVGGRVLWLVGHRLAAFGAVTPETPAAERLDWTAAGGAAGSADAGGAGR